MSNGKPGILSYIRAHRKAIIAAVGAVAVLVVDEETAQSVIALADAALVLLVPNDEYEKARIYGR